MAWDKVVQGLHRQLNGVPIFSKSPQAKAWGYTNQARLRGLRGIYKPTEVSTLREAAPRLMLV